MVTRIPPIRLKTPRELDLMAKAGQIVADTLLLLKRSIRPGVSTRELNEIADRYLRSRGAISSYIQVRFEGVVCISINEEVVHGIPGARTLQTGDIVGLDIAAIYAGYHGDAAVTVGVGEVSREAQHLMDATESALALAISMVSVGRHLYDIGAVVQSYVEGEGFSVVRNLVGHGIGRSMWEEPQVPNYSMDERGPVLRAGTTFTIEPMVNAGAADVEMLPDNWTIATVDHGLSAHFEHTIAVTARGPRILTLPTDKREAWALTPPNPDARLHKPMRM